MGTRSPGSSAVALSHPTDAETIAEITPSIVRCSSVARVRRKADTNVRGRSEERTMMIAALLAALSFSQAPAQAAAGRLAGRITVDGANTPIAGARVVLLPTGRATIGMPPPQVLTDQDGRFVF